jgi:hypothetical protein
VKSTADILREARALIDTPEKWYPANPEGWCIASALVEVDPDTCIPDAQYMLADTLGLSDATRELYAFNDGHTHAEVLTAVDRAIALADAA